MNFPSEPAWRDLGVVFSGDGRRNWMVSHGYVPTALLLPDRIRVFAAFWDADRIGRVGHVDLERGDPRVVMGYSSEPVLDRGKPGAFDEHGTTPMAVVAEGDVLRLYYAGWQRCTTMRYRLFTGLAISRDGGASFARITDTPVLGPTAGHRLVRTGFIAKDGPVWRAWLAQSDAMIEVGGKSTPCYGLFHAQSADGIAWPVDAVPCLAHGQDGIFGYGRSAIWWDGRGYHGMLSVRRPGGYRIEYARSLDGVAWSAPANDGYALLPPHAGDRQGETMFPSVVNIEGVLYAFYNGDGFGRDGIRCARWVSHGH